MHCKTKVTQNKQNSISFIRLFTLLCFFCIFSIVNHTAAQTKSEPATLKGKIVDGKTGEELPFSTIILVGTYNGAQADLEGNYELKNINPGNYSIRFSAIGYSDKLYNNLKFVAGEIKELKVTLSPQSLSLGEVEIVGEKNPINLESGNSEVKIQGDDIRNSNMREVKEIVAMQNGVTQTPDGLQIRGSRVYETQYLVEGISAQDPLAGTGFGVNVSSNAIQDLSVNTSGGDADVSGGTGGVISAKIREGGNKLRANGSWFRDNLNFTGDRASRNQNASWNTDMLNANISGPIPFTKDRLTFFLSGDMSLTDQYFRSYANQLRSSLMDNPTAWAPRYDNSYSTSGKLTFTAMRGFKISLSSVQSMTINQNTRALQVVGFDQIMRPGYQYDFSLNLDNANTFTSKTNLTALSIFKTIGKKFTLDISLGRLFTNLRSDANGRPFRSSTVDQVYDPASIVTAPITVYNASDTTQVYVLPGPGLYNNNGIATRWHDHWVQEYTIKAKLNYASSNRIHLVSFGFEHKEKEYQWADVYSPWIGAPVVINDTLTLPSTSVGRKSDLWKVQPADGLVFLQDEIRYKGIIANIGLQFAYWAPGLYVDQTVDNPNAQVVPEVREQYKQQTASVFGRRYKARLLPKIRVSFPISDNNVMYVAYSHNMRLPHPRFVYAGLDPVYQDKSDLSSLGNPNLNPEVSVNYEIGLKSKLGAYTSAQLTAFYNDRFDYIVERNIEVQDQTGRFVNKSFYINQDYARTRGIELTIFQRIEKVLYVTLGGSYQLITGKSNSANEQALQIKNQGFVTQTREYPGASDTPFNLKFSTTYTPDTNTRLFGIIPLNGMRFYFGAYFRTGIRYTPMRQNGTTALGRPIYEYEFDKPLSKIGSPVFNADIRISRDFKLYKKLLLTLSFEVKNLFNNENAQIINPVTGRAYYNGDPLPSDSRDPRYVDPQDNGTPPFDPSRFQAPRQVLFGLAFQF